MDADLDLLLAAVCCSLEDSCPRGKRQADRERWRAAARSRRRAAARSPTPPTTAGARATAGPSGAWAGTAVRAGRDATRPGADQLGKGAVAPGTATTHSGESWEGAAGGGAAGP